MIVRREIPSDHDAVRALFATVFSAELIDRLRAGDAWLPALSFVALGTNGEIVGHVLGAGRSDRLRPWRWCRPASRPANAGTESDRR